MNVDLNNIQNKYPNILKYFRQELKHNVKLPIVDYVLNTNKQMYDHELLGPNRLPVMISKLDFYLKTLSNETKFTKLINEMKSSDVKKFLSSYSIAELACYFKLKDCSIKLFPTFSGKKFKKELDIAFRLEGSRDVYVEVTTPSLAKKLEQETQEVVFVKDRIVGQVKDEYTNQIYPLIKEGMIKSEPIVIALHCFRTEIDCSELTILYNNKLFDLRAAPKLSAIFCWKESCKLDDDIFLKGEFIENPNADNRLSEKEKLLFN
ncbi:MAG: hypothetical protein QXE05_00155 [Nitrososphaeria archaeon]